MAQGAIPGLLLLLIYTNSLSDGRLTNYKLLAFDTSPFAVEHDINTSGTRLNNDSKKISNWAFQWKIDFLPESSKQTQEVVFSHKLRKISHPSICFNNNPLKQISSQKRIGNNFRPQIKS